MLTVGITTACSDDDDNGQNNIDQQELTLRMQQGGWIITEYIDSGQDETNDFNGFTFSFNVDGTLVASSTATTYNGTWSVEDERGDDNSQGDSDVDFNIFFNLTNEFEDLNDDWDVVSSSDTRLVLIDVSGGNGDIDELTFERN